MTSVETSPAAQSPPDPPARIGSVDAYRGAVMLLMMAEVLELARVADRAEGSAFWETLAYHQAHVAWVGCSVHDMIQPSFSFLVGVALVFSLAGRARRGESAARSIGRATWRALVLIALGIFLRSTRTERTNFTFEDTLTQIGLGYLPLTLIGMARVRWRWVALGVVLVGTWAAFALYPVPGPGADLAAVGGSGDGPGHLDGFAGHWSKNTNVAMAFDRWFLNLFPRPARFEFNKGGYATLSFIPTLGTMLLGLIAGGWLRAGLSGAGRLGRLVLAGAVAIGLGLVLDRLGVCPIVKRIWTPSWVLFSGGIAFLTLAAFHLAIDVAGLRAWAFPLRVIGMNSIAAYVMAELIGDFIGRSLRTHLGPRPFEVAGPAYETLLEGGAVLLVYWLILHAMDRRRLYLRV